MKVIYIAGPYRAETDWEIEKNIREAEMLAIAVWSYGFVALCPHKNTAHFGGILPDESWLKGDLELLIRCDAVLLTKHWRFSSGAKRERLEAIARGIPVFENLQELIDHFVEEDRNARIRLETSTHTEEIQE